MELAARARLLAAGRRRQRALPCSACGAPGLGHAPAAQRSRSGTAADGACGSPAASAGAPAPRRRRCAPPPLYASSPAAEANSEEGVWSPEDMYREGAVRLRALMDALPELSEEELGALLAAWPQLAIAEPSEVRGRLQELAGALDVPLPRAARLAGRVQAVWEQSPAEAAAKVADMARELAVSVDVAVDLYSSQPGMWAVSQPSIIKDRLDTLATKLAVPLPDLAALVGRQALLWVVPPSHVAVTVRQLGEGLGLSHGEAEELVVRAPPAVALEARLLRLSVSGVAATTGVPVPALLGLLSRSLGLAAVPTELLSAALEALAVDLGVGAEAVVGLLATQPTLLCAQYGTIQSALEALEAGLGVTRAVALSVLAAQPGLMYDTTAQTLRNRVEALGSTFGLDAAAAAALAAAQPALLAVAPATVRSAASVLGSRMGISLAECTQLARSDPGAFVMVTLQDSLLEAWAARLQLDPQAVAALLSSQPALLELTPTTVKARLESLAALFGVPLGLAAQLVLKHAALAAVPPNATITRAKNVSTALRMSMQGAASIIAKEPALLGVLAHCAGELRGGPVVDDVGEVGAAYEYYTLEWLQRQLREMQPARVTSFAGLDG